MQRSFVHIYTGDGKGKSTAAAGLAVRARSRGLRVLFVQFMKSGVTGGELELLESISVDVKRFPGVKSPLFNPSLPLDELKKNALMALNEVRELADGYDLVIIDEFNNLVGAGIVSESYAIEFVKGFLDSELVLTGRGATEGMIEVADYVTEMKCVKHPYKKGQKARMGIEY